MAFAVSSRQITPCGMPDLLLRERRTSMAGDLSYLRKRQTMWYKLNIQARTMKQLLPWKSNKYYIYILSVCL